MFCDATGEKACSVPNSGGLGVLRLLVRNEEENVDWECGSLAIAFASGGMVWFGGCDVPAPFPANRFLPLSFLKKKQVTSQKIGTVHFSKVMINKTRRDFSPNMSSPLFAHGNELESPNDPYLSRCIAVALQLNVVISWRPASLKASGRIR